MQPSVYGQGIVAKCMLRTVQQMVDVPDFQAMEEKVEVVQIALKGFSERIIEETVNVPVPQFWKRLSRWCR